MIKIEELLDKLSQFGYLRLHRIIGDYYQIYCPFHSEGKERKPSCGVLLHDVVRGGQTYHAGFCHCFTCGVAYNLLEFLSKLLEINKVSQSALEWLEENVPEFNRDLEFERLVPSDMLDIIQNQFALNYIQTNSNIHTHEYVTEEQLAKYRYTVPYMYERKLTDEIIEKYDIGVDLEWIPPGRKSRVPCITFPVRDKSGNTLFFCRRSIKGKMYNYPQGVTKPLYGIDMVSDHCKSLIVCESCINTLTCVRYGFESVALMGTGNAYQLQQLKELSVPDIVICMDGDDAGRRAAKKLKRALSSTSFVWTIDMPDGKDVNDIDEDEFLMLYNNRR